MSTANQILGIKEKEYTFRDIALAETPEALNEASLGRAYQHFVASGKTSFAILTSWRSDATPEENKRNFAALKQTLASNQLGYFRQVGHALEKTDAGEKDVVEPSVFVIGIPLELALKIRDTYRQTSILYAGPETNGVVTAYGSDGSKDAFAGKFHPGAVAKYYSTVRGHPYFFEGGPANSIEGQATQHLVKEITGLTRFYL